MPEEVTLVDILNQITEQRAFIEQRFGGISETHGLYTKMMEDLDLRIKELERRLSPRSVSLPGAEDEKDKFSWGRAFYAIVNNDWAKAGFEKEIFEQTRKRTLDSGQGSTGGFIVPTQYTGDIIEMLEARMVLNQVGASTINNLDAGALEMPKQTGGATAYWVGENQDITPSDLTFGMLNMTPKSVAALVKTSNRMMKLSNPSVEAIIKRDIALRLALKADLAGLRGQGTQYQPLGVANTPSINSVAIGTDGGNVSFDVLTNMEYALEEDNALFGNLAFVWHPCIRRNLLQLKVAQYSGDTGGEYVIQPITPEQLNGWIAHKYFSTTQIPTNLTKGSGTNLTEIYFANWQELIIAMWGGIEIAASSETSDAFAKVQTWIRIIQDIDIGVRHPESFCLCSDVRKTNA